MKRHNKELKQLIDLGTCCFQTGHDAVKHEEKASDWQLKKSMSSMSKISHERQANYKTVTNATEKDYPIEFVAHRWWKMMQFQKKQGWYGKPGTNTSYDYLSKAVKDFLVPVKLLCFEEVAKKLNKFLVVFQTDKPMAPFLMKTLEDLIRTLMRKFICKDLHSKSYLEMEKLDLINVNNQKPTHHCWFKFCCDHEIQLLKSGEKITDSQKLKFKKEAVGFLITLCIHLMEKSPVKSSFARHLCCLSPNYIEKCSETCEKLSDKAFSKLASYKFITPDTANCSNSCKLQVMQV